MAAATDQGLLDSLWNQIVVISPSERIPGISTHAESSAEQTVNLQCANAVTSAFGD